MAQIISRSSTGTNNDEVLWSSSDSLFTAEHFGSTEHPSGIGREKQINFTRQQSLKYLTFPEPGRQTYCFAKKHWSGEISKECS